MRRKSWVFRACRQLINKHFLSLFPHLLEVPLCSAPAYFFKYVLRRASKICEKILQKSLFYQLTTRPSHFALTLLLLVSLPSCSSSEKTLKVAATPVPHAEMLEEIKGDLEKEGIHLKIIEVDDYNLPNRLLFEKQVDANFFQHTPFLEEQNRRFGYNLKPLVVVHIEPLGIYSNKIESLNQLKERSLVAIPSDPTNEARALKLLAEVSLIKLKPLNAGALLTIYDIEENPKHLKFVEVDAPFLPRALADVDLAVIPANFALQANLNPLEDALALEPQDSPYANIIAIRAGDEGKEELQKLKQVMTSSKLRQFIKDKYKGGIVPSS